ncbi:MAG: hypothetical protein IPJ89_03365 [Candidatus Iainarchaeum archaeon]|uniref:Uncharacterized protein n=1 Tax=Candidatus Iainarchaeum sp. TaxID=3101447 RepID=A0A7T9DIW2_9ARCH|nr:MAG: hypothetical protein IPJ89_03365 [Candidatus Diapherotrites archaeon]
MTKTQSKKTVFYQRMHPIPVNYKWAFVLITIALLAVAAILSDKTTTAQIDTPISPVTLHQPLPVPPIQERPVVLADALFQQALEAKPIPGKYVYNGKMPGIQTFGSSTTPSDFTTFLQNIANRQGTTTLPTAPSTGTTTTTAPRDFGHVAFVDNRGLIGVKTTTPSTGSILTDLFLSAIIQPTTFKVGDEILRCPLGYCMILTDDPGTFPTPFSLLPTTLKSKSQLLAQPFTFVGVRTVRGRDCDAFETGNGNTLQSICIDQQTHMPAKYEDGHGYVLELTTIQTSDYLVETSYPSSMALYPNHSQCGLNPATQAREATIAFLPVKSGWAGQQREMELEFYLPAQNPMITTNAKPVFIQKIKIAGKRGEKVTQTFQIAGSADNQYSVRGCVGSDCTAAFNCAFESTPPAPTEMTADACTQAGGTIYGNPGGGISCPAGQREIGLIPLGIEGSICCR